MILAQTRAHPIIVRLKRIIVVIARKIRTLIKRRNTLNTTQEDRLHLRLRTHQSPQSHRNRRRNRDHHHHLRDQLAEVNSFTINQKY